MGALFRLSCLAVLVAAAKDPQLETGDVVLQTSRSSRSELIQKASDSPYSHVGLVEVAADGVFVIEAVQPVSRTPWKRFVARGVGGVKVLRAKDLDAETRSKVVAEAKKALGKPYDARYRWDDARLYCSELVTKAFERAAHRTIGVQQRVDSLQLSRAELKLAASKGIPGDQLLVTPGSIANDPSLTEVE